MLSESEPVEQTATRRRLGLGFGRRAWVPYAVLGLSLLATALVGRFIAATTAEVQRLHFEDAASAVVRSVAERMQTYGVALDAGVGLFASSRTPVDADRFERFARQFGVGVRHPGIQGYGYTHTVPADEREAFEARLHREGYPGFRVWPNGRRGTYQPVTYLFPQDARNRAALGYDMRSQATRAETMDRARDTGQAVLSEPVVLVQEIDEDVQRGILLYVPVYRPGAPTETVEERRAALEGFVYAPFRAEDLFEGIFEQQPSNVSYSVYDGEPGSGALLYQSGHVTGAPDELELSLVRSLDVAGRTWTLVFRPEPQFLKSSADMLLVPLSVGIGVIVSFALFFLVLRETRARARAIDVATELQRSEQRLRDASRAKDEFLAMLGHELRNPLAATRSALEVLRLSGDLHDDDAVAALAAAERQMLRQKHLVDDLLDVSRVSRGKIALRREDLDLRAVFAEAVETARAPAREKSQQLEVVAPAQPIPVNGDPTRLVQVLQNLLSNAVKYTPEGGTVTASLALEEGQAVARVRDTGIGIPSEALDRIFELFAQVDTSLARSTGGLGIGLTLSRRLVEMHGGTLEAHSDGPGLGSEFVVRLPVTDRVSSPASRERADWETNGRDQSLRVLVVEDNDDARSLSERLLRRWGYDVMSAADGERGVRVALEERPDVALVDIGLPNMDGFEVARRIRSEVPLDQMVLVAVSGYGREEDRKRSAEAGFDQHLTKPVEPPELRRILREATAARRPAPPA